MSAVKKKEKVLRITLTKSPIGYSRRQKGTVRALGLRRMHQMVEQKDTSVIRGMIAKVSHLVTVEEVN
jgi:large subunit ribosomal protein L30